jgi:hypothetical protein
VLENDTTKRILTFAATPNSTLKLSATGSTDPDQHALSYVWTVYPEASSYPNDVRLSPNDAIEACLLIPADAAGKELHVILTVRDTGQPPLASYRRAVVRIDPVK